MNTDEHRSDRCSSVFIGGCILCSLCRLHSISDRAASCLLLDSGLAFYEYGWRCPPHPTSVSWPTQGVIRAEARPVARSGPQARLGALLRRRERGLPGSGERASLVAAGHVARLG